MSQPLMPKATCVWLIDNTSLTFEQIGNFCAMHALEVQAVADGEVAQGIIGRDPIVAGELTRDEITRCEADSGQNLVMSKIVTPRAAERTKGPRYTAMAKRQDKPDGIAWLVRNHPEVSDTQVGKLLGTTKNTIAAVRDRTHWNTQNIRPRQTHTRRARGHRSKRAGAGARRKTGQQRRAYHCRTLRPPRRRGGLEGHERRLCVMKARLTSTAVVIELS